MDGRRTTRDALLLVMAALVVPSPSYAQTAASFDKSSGQAYPTKPVRVVAPYPPGSSADVIGRIYAPRLADALGRQFIVDNRPGASGNIAAELVARANPDGYTLLILNNAIAGSQFLHKGLTFDVARDFYPIGMLGLAPYLLVVNISLPVKTSSCSIQRTCVRSRRRGAEARNTSRSTTTSI